MQEQDGFFKVDRTKCIKCSLCVKDCAFRALRSAEDGSPEMAVPANCMRCQHCFAICPAGAISIDGKDSGDAVLSSGAALPKPEEVENFMALRRSTRQFAKKDVDRDLIKRILETLGNVPTGCNARSLTFTCYPDMAAMDSFRKNFIKAIEDHDTKGKVLPRWLAVPAIRMRKSGEDLFFRGAPGMVIISSDETSPDVKTPETDVSAACAYFEMLAQAHGLATCWCGFLRMVCNEVPELLEKTSGIRRTTPFYAMLFGLPAVKYKRGVLRSDYAKIDWRQS